MNNHFLISAAPSSAAASPTEDSYIGQWVMKVNATEFLVLKLFREAEDLKGAIICPARFSTLGNLFFNISAAIITLKMLAIHMDAGQLIFDVKDNNEGATCHCAMSLKTSNQALLTGFRLSYEPWILDRNCSDKLEIVTASFEPNRSYSQDGSNTPNREIQHMFEEDQASCTASESSAPKLASNLSLSIKNLIATGSLCSGFDFEQAAFILHHSASVEDCLLAHTLATIAVAKGNTRAIWIVAATLDRYLQTIGKPQIYGTQFETHDDGTVTQEPYDRDFISDIVRRHLGVPPLYLQEEQIKNVTPAAFTVKSKQ